MNSPVQKQKKMGFTLIEVLAATLILSGTILAFIRIMADNLTIARETELRFKSMLLAEGDMERIKAALYADFSEDVSLWSTDMGGGYRVTRSVTSVSTYLKEVSVEVGYDTSGNDSLDSGEVLVALQTQYANY